jgi:hypothetical protein
MTMSQLTRLILFLVLMLLLVQILVFWGNAVNWGTRLKRSFGKRLRRFRSAAVDACEEA